jgi:hypothetical protein
VLKDKSVESYAAYLKTMSDRQACLTIAVAVIMAFTTIGLFWIGVEQWRVGSREADRPPQLPAPVITAPFVLPEVHLLPEPQPGARPAKSSR